MTIHEFAPHEMRLSAKLKIRMATADDVAQLEWNGQFTHFRHLFRRAYKEQRRGNRVMLVMDFNGYPVARLFIQFMNDKDNSGGYIYSFTVMEPFRNLGIGTRMLATAESILQKRNYSVATISVSKTNLRALKLYKRQGYQVYGEDDGQWQYLDHEGRTHYVNEPSWLMKKSL